MNDDGEKEALDILADARYERSAGLTDPKNLLGARMVKAASLIGSIAKDGYNKFHDYEYVTEAAIKRAVGPALREAGLYIAAVQHTLVLPVLTIGEGAKAQQHVLCETTVVIRGVRDQLGTGMRDPGNAYVVARSIGSGSDRGDKAAYKAMAGGLKYALTSMFLIPTPDEDAEFDGGKKPDAPKPEAEETVAPKAKAVKAPKPAKVEESSTAFQGTAIDPTVSTNTALAFVREVGESKSDTELKNLAEKISKKMNDMSDADFASVKAAFKARMAELKGSK